MFGKLLKYDFRSMLKQFAFIWPTALVLAIVNRFTLDGLDSTSSVGETTAGIAMLVYVAILISMFIVAVNFVIQRFYKGLLGDEGYLMHTLPVKPWQLIGSKLACALVVTVVNILVAILSILLIVPWAASDLKELFEVFQYLFTHWNIQATQVMIAMLEFVLFSLTSFAVGYLHLYLSMAIGHLFNKNRVAMSVIAFIAIQVLLSILGTILARPFSDLIYPAFSSLDGMPAYHISMWVLIAGEVLLAAVYFVGTEYILRKRLNLE